MIKTENGAWLTVTEAITALQGRRTRTTIHRWIEKSVVRSRHHGGELQVWSDDVMKAVKVITRGAKKGDARAPGLTAPSAWAAFNGIHPTATHEESFKGGWKSRQHEINRLNAELTALNRRIEETEARTR